MVDTEFLKAITKDFIRKADVRRAFVEIYKHLILAQAYVCARDAVVPSDIMKVVRDLYNDMTGEKLPVSLDKILATEPQPSPY